VKSIAAQVTELFKEAPSLDQLSTKEFGLGGQPLAFRLPWLANWAVQPRVLSEVDCRPVRLTQR